MQAAKRPRFSGVRTQTTDRTRIAGYRGSKFWGQGNAPLTALFLRQTGTRDATTAGPWEALRPQGSRNHGASFPNHGSLSISRYDRALSAGVLE